MDNMNEADKHELAENRKMAAILLKVPESGTPWLDAMIRQSLRQEFAKAALQGVLHNLALSMRHVVGDLAVGADFRDCARQAVFAADALLAELEKGGGG